MRRREFIKLIGGVALSGSNAAIAQPAITVVGLLSSRTLDDSELAAIRDGLKSLVTLRAELSRSSIVPRTARCRQR